MYTAQITRIASDQTVSIRELHSLVRAPRFAFDDQRFDQLRYRDVAFAAAPSGAADGLHIVDGARFITFSNTRFSILVFEYSFWKYIRIFE